MYTFDFQRKRLITLTYIDLLQKISRKSFWVIIDQGLFAFSNFALSIFLARLLSPTEYGIFSTTLAIFSLPIVLHTAVLVEPMLVFGANKYKTDSSNYQGAMSYLHWAFSFTISGLLLMVAIGSYFLNNGVFVWPLVAISTCCGFLLLPWLARRLCYLSQNSRLAAIMGLTHLLMTLAGITVMDYFHYTSWLSALVLLSITSLCSGWWILYRLKVPLFAWPERKFVHKIIRTHWQYGRWALLTSILIWIPYNLSYLIVPLWYGIEANAAFKAINNLIVPVQQTFAALSVFLLPIFAQKTSVIERDKLIQKLVIAFNGLSISYWLFVGIFNQSLLWGVYGGNYLEYSQLVWVLGLAPVATGLTAVYGSALRSQEKPNYVFVAYLIATLVTVTIGTGSTYIWSLWGAAASLALSMFSAGFVLIFFYYSKR